MTTRTTDKGAARILKMMRELGAARVEVGGLDEQTASKLAFSEFGTSTAPARPVIRQTIEARRERMGKTMEAELDLMLARGIKVDAAMAKIGAAFTAELRAAIYAFTSPPNAESTVLRKLKNDPLVDTGAMARGVSWRVVKTRGSKK